MKVQKLMSHDCATVQPVTSLDEAAHLMWKHDCGSLPVIDYQDQVVGMITDRDICMHAYHQGLDLKQLRVGGAMSQHVHTCSVDEDTDSAQERMREHQVRRLPVVDAEGRLQGILTLAQLARAGGSRASNGISATQVGGTLADISRPLA